MAVYKPRGKKIRLVKRARQTKWAPFWTTLKKYGKGRKVHPSRHTVVKRNWRKTKLRV